MAWWSGRYVHGFTNDLYRDAAVLSMVLRLRIPGVVEIRTSPSLKHSTFLSSGVAAHLGKPVG